MASDDRTTYPSTLPTLNEALARDFHRRITTYTTELRALADRVEQVATHLGTTPGLRKSPITAAEVAADILHEIEWGLANASASRIVAAAHDYDNRDEK